MNVESADNNNMMNCILHSCTTQTVSVLVVHNLHRVEFFLLSTVATALQPKEL